MQCTVEEGSYTVVQTVELPKEIPRGRPAPVKRFSALKLTNIQPSSKSMSTDTPRMMKTLPV